MSKHFPCHLKVVAADGSVRWSREDWEHPAGPWLAIGDQKGTIVSPDDWAPPTMVRLRIVSLLAAESCQSSSSGPQYVFSRAGRFPFPSCKLGRLPIGCVLQNDCFVGRVAPQI